MILLKTKKLKRRIQIQIFFGWKIRWILIRIFGLVFANKNTNTNIRHTLDERHNTDDDYGSRGGKNGGRGQCRDRRQRCSSFGDQSRGNSMDRGQFQGILNLSLCQSCKCTTNEQYKDAFHPGNLRCLTTRPRTGIGISSASVSTP